MAGTKYGFCHGWMIEPVGHTEVTCKQRERYAYFDVEFYRNHGHHLEDFEEMFPYEPCKFFIPKSVEEKNVKKEDNPFDLFFGKK